MKIIVTGGAGFIGSAVIRQYINETAHEVINLDALTYAGNLESLAEVSDNSRYCFEHVDIRDHQAIKHVFDKHQPDAIMHLAAESHVDRSISGPADIIRTNIVGTYNLLDVTKSYWEKLPKDRKDIFRFHHVSTDEVYGDLGETGLFTEETAYEPSSPYSASKASSDHLVRAWCRTYGLQVVITSNNYGPCQFPEKLIPLVTLNALEGKPLPNYGKGDQIRDWLFVDDHARALRLVLEKGKVGETYNIGGHNEKQNIEVVETICEILDELLPFPLMTEAKHISPSPLRGQNCRNNFEHALHGPKGEGQEPGIKGRGEGEKISFKSLITFVTDRPGHDVRYAIDVSKIARDLGWEPEETFETGLKKTIQWYLVNAEWCQQFQDGNYQRERLGVGVVN